MIYFETIFEYTQLYISFHARRLSIQLENNDALKQALEESLQSKDEDLKVFHKMVEETKKIFLQGLRQFRANATSSAS